MGIKHQTSQRCSLKKWLQQIPGSILFFWCPLNIGSAVFRSPYQGKMLLIATTKQNTLSSESPFPEIHFASSATSCFLSFNKVVFSLSIFLIYKGVNNTENACNEAKWTQKYDLSLGWNLLFMFLTCIQTPPSAQIKKLGRETSVDRPR